MKYLQYLKNKVILKTIIAIVVLLVGGIFLFTNEKNTKTSSIMNLTPSSTSIVGASSTISSTTSIIKTTNKTISPSYASKCGLTVAYPIINSSITFPLVVKGVIDNSKADELGCSWNVVSSRAGEAQIFYYSKSKGWVAPGISVPIVTSTGKVASTTAFSVSFNIYTKNLGISSGTPMKVVFTELKPLDYSKQDSFELLVYLK